MWGGGHRERRHCGSGVDVAGFGVEVGKVSGGLLACGGVEAGTKVDSGLFFFKLGG